MGAGVGAERLDVTTSANMAIARARATCMSRRRRRRGSRRRKKRRRRVEGDWYSFSGSSQGLLRFPAHSACSRRDQCPHHPAPVAWAGQVAIFTFPNPPIGLTGTKPSLTRTEFARSFTSRQTPIAHAFAPAVAASATAPPRRARAYGPRGAPRALPRPRGALCLTAAGSCAAGAACHCAPWCTHAAPVRRRAYRDASTAPGASVSSDSAARPL